MDLAIEYLAGIGLRVGPSVLRCIGTPETPAGGGVTAGRDQHLRRLGGRTRLSDLRVCGSVSSTLVPGAKRIGCLHSSYHAKSDVFSTGARLKPPALFPSLSQSCCGSTQARTVLAKDKPVLHLQRSHECLSPRIVRIGASKKLAKLTSFSVDASYRGHLRIALINVLLNACRWGGQRHLLSGVTAVRGRQPSRGRLCGYCSQ